MTSLRPVQSWLAGAALLLTMVSGATAAELKGTVVDRQGKKHLVSKIAIRGTTTLEYYLNGKRQLLTLSRVDRLRIEGTPQDQEVPIVVTFRSGRVDNGMVIINGGSSPHDDVVGGGSHVSDRLTGSTDLGPLFIPLSDIREVIFEHDEDAPIIPDQVNGSIVDERGKRFVVTDIRYRGDDAFRFSQGRKKRRVALRHVSRLEFGDSPGGEMRPVKITYHTGRIVQGEVDASTVRLPGEVDHVYRTRVDSSFTGQRTAGRPYGIGLDRVKLVLFDEHEKDEDSLTGKTDASAPESDD